MDIHQHAIAVADGYVAAADQAENFLPPPKEDFEAVCRALVNMKSVLDTIYPKLLDGSFYRDNDEAVRLLSIVRRAAGRY